MTTAYFDLNANFTTEDLTCNDVHLGLNKTIYGDTSLNLDCAVINLGKSG